MSPTLLSAHCPFPLGVLVISGVKAAQLWGIGLAKEGSVVKNVAFHLMAGTWGPQGLSKREALFSKHLSGDLTYLRKSPLRSGPLADV